MNIRRFAMALMLLAAPLAAEGQSARNIPRIGFLGTFQESPHYQAFMQGLRDVGFVEGQNLSIERRYSEGKAGRLPDLATALVRLKLDLIASTPAGHHSMPPVKPPARSRSWSRPATMILWQPG